MKNKQLLLALAAIFVLVSCETDSDSDNYPIPTSSSQRIKQIIYEHGGNYDLKYIFTYEGDKLAKYTECIKDNGKWKENYIEEISYAGDIATVTSSNKVSGSWSSAVKLTYVIQNGLIMEEVCYNPISHNCTYHYSGTDITGFEVYYGVNRNDTLVPNLKGEYIYQNGQLSEFIITQYQNDSLQDRQKVVYANNGGNMINCIRYIDDESDNWINYSKSDYEYSGDNVSKADYFLWNSDSSQWVSNHSESYTYNSFGYLIESLANNGDKIIYQYEEGNGNAKLFWYTPANSVNLEPRLRSASTASSSRPIPYYQRLNSILP